MGSQPSFWSLSGGDYWGVTTIQRNNFEPPEQFGEIGFIPSQRLQADQIGRNIVGEAEPGTLVRLTQGFGREIIDETVVDSSGIYRFENILLGNRANIGNYQVLLYPQGRLTSTPEVRNPTFSTVPGQIPAGATTTLLSAGFGRNTNIYNDFFGDINSFKGGLLQRWGVSENVTFGVGGIYDKNFRGLGEIFFQPTGTNLEIAGSILTPDEDETWVVDSNILYTPIPEITARFNSDEYSRRLNLDLRIVPGVTLISSYNNRDGLAGGIQTIFSGPRFFSYGRVILDENNRLRWNLNQRLGNLEFTQQGNEIQTNSELRYNFSNDPYLDTGHSVIVGYNTRNINKSDDEIGTVGWSYRSPERAADGSYLWETSLEYGLGSQGDGAILTIQSAAVNGILLRGRYEGISVNSDRENFGIEVASSLNFQGLFPGDRESDRLRIKGGFLIQPFLDQNSNGKLDQGESYYTENVDELFLMNYQPFNSLRINGIIADPDMIELNENSPSFQTINLRY